MLSFFLKNNLVNQKTTEYLIPPPPRNWVDFNIIYNMTTKYRAQGKTSDDLQGVCLPDSPVIIGCGQILSLKLLTETKWLIQSYHFTYPSS